MSGKKKAAKQGRFAEVRRRTRETDVRVSLALDAPDRTLEIATGVPFLDHMLDALRTHGRLGLSVRAEGDLHVDAHHTVEDVGIAFGTAVREAVAEGGAIVRYAHAYAPLDESLARCVIDVCDRPYLHWGVELSRARVGDFDTDLTREFFHGFVRNARVTLHLDLVRGANAHHEIECLFKATALSLRTALAVDASLAGGAEVASTKGTLHEAAARQKKVARQGAGSGGKGSRRRS